MLTRDRSHHSYSRADETVDVLVVGGGGAGLAAAIEAAESGARVVLLEKNDAPGGSTSWSIGSVSASQTPHQRAQGIADTPEAHWEDMPGFAGELAPRDNDALRRVLCDAMPDTFQWLLDSGIRFMGPMPEPPHRVPRMHNVLPNSRSFIYHLTRRAQRADVAIRVRARVVELVFENGDVKGVLYEADGATKRIDARGGVILAAGDFTNSPELKARFMGAQEAKVAAVNPTATGDGQRMAERCGARIVNGDLALGPEIRFIAPAKENFVRRLPPWRSLAAVMQWSMKHLPDAILRPFLMKFLTTALAPALALFEDGALLVNARGERFGDETDKPAYRLPDQPDGVGYIIIDGRIAERYSAWPHFISTAPGVAYAYLADYRRNRPDVYREADSIEGLAAATGMNAAALAESVKSASGPRTLSRAPYIALGPVRAVFVHAEGGLMVDESHRVLDAGGAPIGGLRAAGSTGQGGLLLKGHGHHLAWAFASGRRAGRFAAQAARSAPAGVTPEKAATV
ncbi:tricarballylate dehydrogenase [Caballeronia hypogeia]|uniref:Tricarballylate dehydrogenase n=1 Tax=Caballeronia hypogeia TaxID=1777140 RepID=A0A158DPU8_9BURK|nr:FAD-dependent oxidoreductase [Caballeronia hypogeia]SAK95777.1 tricarballylate dehydrogenase [Caballeronia hypogeia]